jgi:hypothetical protein
VVIVPHALAQAALDDAWLPPQLASDVERSMIIWRGWGVLVAVFAFGAALAAELIVESTTGDDQYFQREAWPLALALVAAGVLTWLVGRKLNAGAARTVIDKATGRELTIDRSHTFFFVPMHYWGVVLLALAVLPFVLRR